MSKYLIVERSKSFNGLFDCCTIQDNYNHGQLIFAHNESGKWEIMNYKNINPLDFSNIIEFITKSK